MSSAEYSARYSRGELTQMLIASIQDGQPKDVLRTLWMAYAMRCEGNPTPLFNFVQREALNGRAK